MFYLSTYAAKLGRSLWPLSLAYQTVLNCKRDWSKGEGEVSGWRLGGSRQSPICHPPVSPPAHLAANSSIALKLSALEPGSVY